MDGKARRLHAAVLDTGDEGEPHFAFRWGNGCFYFFDAMDALPGEQASGLVAKAPRDAAVGSGIMHRFGMSPYEAGASALMVGHDRLHERADSGGREKVVSGGGGARL